MEGGHVSGKLERTYLPGTLKNDEASHSREVVRVRVSSTKTTRKNGPSAPRRAVKGQALPLRQEGGEKPHHASS